ncbi:MAG TPA: hypothetical protein VLT86_09835 [Vicinamibacterales bacterium]|nr:hypothetical protein [Vicinamibacterales bacterium]
MSAATGSSSKGLWIGFALCLLLLRAPALVQPPGGDQSLYTYSGQRLLEGGVPYEAAWDQKPPGIFVVYALLWSVWPHPSLVALADLVAAGIVASLLATIGCRLFGVTAGGLAACVFLLFGHPSLTRLSGVYVRGQCETFIGLAVAAGIVLILRPGRGRWALAFAGVMLGLAVWLKYNALAYALPLAIGVAAWREPSRTRRQIIVDLGCVAAGAALVTAVALTYFAAHGALRDLRLATIDYNLRYSSETYAGPFPALTYLVTLPVTRARVDMLWFLGGLGALLTLRRRFGLPATLTIAWLVAAMLSIAVNGARDLPQYFVQAAPPLALAAGAGLAGLSTRPVWLRAAVAVLVAAGLWRVGDEPAGVAGCRLAGLPQLAGNIRFDVDRALGRVDDAAYLSRFASGKYDAAAADEMTRYVRSTTAPADSVLVFGFAGGSVGAWSERRSPTRFFWSRPIMIDFAAGQPGYGPDGLLRDLRADPPALVILQKRDWSVGEALPDSAEFFLANADLRGWLEKGYTADRETSMFSVWRRRS